MRHRSVFTLSLLVCGWLVALGRLASPALAEARVALVIGNSAYANTTPLANPLNDARLMSEALKSAGFDVVEALDADKRKIDGALRSFTDKLTGADVALFYYAGHGLQVGAQNYLVPTDAKLERERDLEFEAVKLDFVLRQMEIDREGKTSIVMLDACRDNPLARTLARSMGTRSAGIGRGLAAAATGLGTFIAYATQPGNVALDGSGQNSPFTTALAKHMRVKGRNLNATMIEVRKEVVAATNGNQVPWDHSALTGDFYFVPGEAAPAGAVSPAPAGNAADMAALQARLAKLEQEAKEREKTPATKAAQPVDAMEFAAAIDKRVKAREEATAAATQADAFKLADLRKRADGLQELVDSLAKKKQQADQIAASAREGSAVKAEQSATAGKIELEIARRNADLARLKAEMAALEIGKASAANVPPVTPKARPLKVSPDFDETDNVAIKGTVISRAKAPSPLACRTECEKDSSCVAFQHGKKAGNMGQCELYSSVEARSEDLNWRSGVRTAAVSDPNRDMSREFARQADRIEQGFMVFNGAKLEGELIKTSLAESTASCATICRNTPGCAAAVFYQPTSERVKAGTCQVLATITGAAANLAPGTFVLYKP